MVGLYVFTAGVAAARAHIEDSISNPVDFAMLAEVLPKHEAGYMKRLLEGSKGFYAWGAVPGQKNIPNWESMREGDIVLAAYDGRYRYISSVVLKLHSPRLAESIWGLDADGKTWEYMYVLTEPRAVNVEVDSEPLSGYLHKAYRGFTRINQDRINRIFDDYGSIHNFIAAEFQCNVPLNHPPIEEGLAERELQTEGAFDPDNAPDERKRVMAAIVRRRGQPKFRRELLDAYGGECAVTGCSVESILEAAHIKPYGDGQTNHVTNGMLLRADIHTLFDLGELRVDDKGVIHLSDELRFSSYVEYSGKKVRFPEDPSKAPNAKALKQKFRGGLLGVA